MGKHLAKREFEYKRNLFEALNLNQKDVVGKSFWQLSELISKNFRKLSPQFHPDKKGGSADKMSVLNSSKIGLEEYIQDLKHHGITKTVIWDEIKNVNLQLSSKRKKACLSYIKVISLNKALHVILFFYLTIILINKCKNFQLNLNNALFAGALICLIAIPISCTALFFRWIAKKSESAEQGLKEKYEKDLRAQFSGKDLDTELKKVCNSENFKASVREEVQASLLSNSEETIKSIYIDEIKCVKYLWGLSITLIAAGLIAESALNDFKTVDTKLLIGLSLIMLSFGLQYLADEIYERKVINLVKEERKEGKTSVTPIFGGYLQPA